MKISKLINANPIGIMSIATHLGILGAISIGYSISTFTSSQLPHANEIRTKKVISLAVYRPIWNFASVENNDL